MNRKHLLIALSVFGVLSLVSCNENSSSTSSAYFSYSPTSSTTIGAKTNAESHPYSSLKVDKVDDSLRDDFAMGVDASMVYDVEKAGGVYFNAKGQEQDIFEILRDNGVNFVRFRLWNDPVRKVGKHPYGGGDNSYAVDLAMAKRVKAAGLNVMIDFHYSDFWADPDYQQCPKAWQTFDYKNPANADIPNAVKTFTASTLSDFKNEGVVVDAVQIGNEINNGIAGYAIDWNDMTTSFSYVAKVLSAGIEGAKSVNPNVRSVIHLANGGNKDEFQTFFEAMDSHKVDYDIIGASYYPYLAGSLDSLQTNLDNISTITGKPVMICEMSWGFTTDFNDFTANQYTTDDEDVGGYLTSEQAQATAIRDVINVLSKVPGQKGLGIFYWEPGWLPVSSEVMWASKYGQAYQYTGDDSQWSDYSDGLDTWANQGLFSYSGKALSSLQVFAKVKAGFNEISETSVSARHLEQKVAINVAAKETLPSLLPCETNFDAIRQFPVVYEAGAADKVKVKGSYTFSATIDGQYAIQVEVTCIENFVVDPGYENQGETDSIKSPWVLRSSTPVGDKVAKLDRKKDIRNGKTDLNWYHGSQDFTFDVYQTIKSLPSGSYTLSTYIMAIAPSKIAHTKLDVYVQIPGQNEKVVDMKNVIDGWGVPDHYKLAQIDGIVLSATSDVVIGIRGAGKAGAWGHNDDWSLISKE